MVYNKTRTTWTTLSKNTASTKHPDAQHGAETVYLGFLISSSPPADAGVL